MPTQDEIDQFNKAVQEFADREGLEFDEAAKQFGALLVNIEEHAKEIYTLRIAFEELEQRVEDLENA